MEIFPFQKIAMLFAGPGVLLYWKCNRYFLGSANHQQGSNNNLCVGCKSRQGVTKCQDKLIEESHALLGCSGGTGIYNLLKIPRESPGKKILFWVLEKVSDDMNLCYD